jgi:3-hydroxyisobutyrate dehydrogenase-like beta-hydroxyacid dehydrogenase
MTRVALVGLGEVGRVFAEDLAAGGVTDLVAWDTAFSDPSSTASRNAASVDVHCASSGATAVVGADLVISAVTAAHCSAAADETAPGLAPGAWYFDLNSSSPAQKRESARLVEESSGRYVEAALMSPIAPRRLTSPFLLGGPHAADFVEAAETWGLGDVTVFSAEVGQAAAAKLCRSVIVKGLESLFSESLLAARSYGVEKDVLDSLSNILPPADWEAVATYFVTRSLRHGRRRSEEMVEAAATVADTGIEPWMARAAAQRQAWAAERADALTETDLLAIIDHIRTSVRDKRTSTSAGREMQ